MNTRALIVTAIILLSALAAAARAQNTEPRVSFEMKAEEEGRIVALSMSLTEGWLSVSVMVEPPLTLPLAERSRALLAAIEAMRHLSVPRGADRALRARLAKVVEWDQVARKHGAQPFTKSLPAEDGLQAAEFAWDGAKGAMRPTGFTAQQCARLHALLERHLATAERDLAAKLAARTREAALFK